MILKIDKQYLYYNGCYCSLSNLYLDGLTKKGNKLTDGKLTLSVKRKSKRVLVNGRLSMIPRDDYFDGHLYWEYHFYPNNPTKLSILL